MVRSMVKNILWHYGWQLAVVVGYGLLGYGIKRWQASRHKAAPKQQRPQSGVSRARCRYISPAQGQYAPSNPRWLSEAVQHSPEEFGTDLLECPALQAFKEELQHKAGTSLPSFGEAARKQLFCLEEQVTYLNHGSYGAAFRLSMEVQSWYQQQLELQPVRFMETVAVHGVQQACAAVAHFVGASPSDVVPVTNATTAVNAVLQSLNLRRGQVLLILNTTYPAVRSAAARVAAAAYAKLLEVELTLDDLATPSHILDAVQHALRTVPRGRLKLAILDHVVSFPPVIMPVAQLVKMCQQVGAQVLVDGAHAIGTAIPNLCVPDLGADYYCSNLHKWSCTPKGAAFLWVHPSKQHQMLPPVVSHGYGLGFQGEFLWQGTRDMTAWLAVPAALQLLQALGVEQIAQYNDRLVHAAVDLFRQQWPEAGLQCLGGDAEGHTAGMLAISLPPLQDYPPDPSAATRLHDLLRNEHHIEVPVIALQRRLWVRLSAQMYNTLQDYRHLVAALQPLVRANPAA